MPTLLVPLVGLILGIGFAWCASGELARSSGNPWGTQGLLVALSYGLLVLGPALGLGLAVAPDWTWSYVLGPGGLSRGLGGACTVAAALSPAAGFAAAARAAARRQFRSLVRLAALPGTLGALATAIALPRLLVYGTYGQFHGSFGMRPVAGSWVGYALLWVGLAGAGATWVACRGIFQISSASHAHR